ncbi:MAG: caleosin family protein, partial [Proteobacteria bacterium]|nr:caleosin family protein [Pseudomonadota bacterium]
KFFDADGDGLITMAETYHGLRALGQSRLEAAKTTTLVNLFLGPKTSTSWLSLFSINISNIHLGIHDSDTSIYDENGSFDEPMFNALIKDFDVNNDGAISESEMATMIATNKESTFGNMASSGEFASLMELSGEEREIDGEKVRVLTVETLKNFYTTNFLQTAADKIAANKANKEVSDKTEL